MHYLLYPNIDKSVDFIFREVVLINNFLTYLDHGNIVVFMLHHYVIEIKFIDVDHKVIGAWGLDDAVPMQF